MLLVCLTTVIVLNQSAYAKSTSLQPVKASALSAQPTGITESLKRKKMTNLFPATTAPDGNFKRALTPPSSVVAALKQSSGVISMTVLFVLWYAFNAGCKAPGLH
ncbi:hypothetical protein EON65_39885 [archaeon]|nr:MAG: hypothetical protein EON65_39885 [archaeon]